MDYTNKRILFMGDSITALGTGERGWVGYFNEVFKPSFFRVDAVSGARLAKEKDVELDGNPVFLGDKTDYTQNVMLNQIEMVSRARKNANPDYDDFDLIIIAAGTNDAYFEENCNPETIEEQFTKDGKVVPSSEVNCCTWSGAMRIIYERLKEFYPNAKICFCSPIQAEGTIRPYKYTLHKRNLIKAICDRISDVIFVDTFNCGICGIYEKPWDKGRDLIDGLHPNINGAKKIAEYNIRAIKQSLE